MTAPPDMAPPAVSHVVHVRDIALLAASASPVASSAVDDFEVVRDRIDRAIRTGLFIVTSPLVVPIVTLGLLQGVICFYRLCNGSPLLSLSGRLLDFFFPPTAATAAVAGAASATRASVALPKRAHTATPHAAQHSSAPADQASVKKTAAKSAADSRAGRGQSARSPH
ncbi:hypothetical protein [Mycolicibacterium sphagni]|nr:hypothetical protein [Mycolicibacterium sphagni]